jgi:hypothetical protein
LYPEIASSPNYVKALIPLKTSVDQPGGNPVLFLLRIKQQGVQGWQGVDQGQNQSSS